MVRFIVRRLGFMVMTVILASIIIFWATTVLPGDLASQILGRFATQQAKDDLRAELGLDKPVVSSTGAGSAPGCRATGGSRRVRIQRFARSSSSACTTH